MHKPLPKEARVFDIETRRHPNLRAALGIDEKIARLDDLEVDDLKLIADRESFKLGNRKNRESVYACIVDNFDRQVSKAALKLYGCEITAIGMAPLGEGTVQALVVDVDLTETQMIESFLRVLDRDAPVLMIGFNIRGFDLPVLRTRCALLGIHWPAWLPSTRREDKYDTDYVFDIQDVLDEGNLDTWLRMSGLPPKTGSGGSLDSLSTKELAQYCADDVERERMLARKVLVNYAKHSELLNELEVSDV